MAGGSSTDAGEAGEVRAAGKAGPSLPAVAEEPDTSPSSSFDGSGLRTPTPATAQLRQQPPWPSAAARTMAPPGKGLLSYSRPANVEAVPVQPPKTPSEGPGGSRNTISPTRLSAPGSSSNRRGSSGAGNSASPQRPKGRVGKGMPLVRPTPSASQHAGQRRGVIASSLDLVFSYSRSHAFFGDNLPSSPSFVAHYRRPGYHDEEEGTESSYLGTESSDEYSDEDGLEDESSRNNEFGERLSLSSSMSPEGEEDSQQEALPPNATARLVVEERRRKRRQRPGPDAGARQPSATSDEYDADDNAGEERSIDDRAPVSERTDLLAAVPRARQSYGAFKGSDDEDDLARVPFQAPLSSQPSPPFARSSDLTTKIPLASPSKLEDRSSVGESTFGQTLFNSFNVLCGVGLLSEPLAFASAGWVGGAGLLAFCGLVTNYTAKVLARILLDDRNLLTYNDIGCKAFGSGVRWLISFLFCIELFALAVALVVIFADSFHVLFPDPSLLAFKLLAFLVVLPTVFLPYRLLSYTSLIGLLSSLVLVVVVIVDGAVKADGPGSLRHPEPTSWAPGRSWGLSAGLIMSGFSGHAVMPSLARDMRHPQHFDSMVNLAYLLAGVMYAAIGITGYLMFGNGVTNEITKDLLSTPGYPKVLNKISVWMVAINPVVKFALGTRPLNTVLEHLLGVGATPLPRPRSSSFRSRRRSSAHSARPAAPMFSPSNGSDALSATPRSKAPGRRPSSATVDGGAVGKSMSGISALGSALSVVPETLARQREGVKATLRVVLRVVLTAFVVFVAIVFPDFDRVMSFLGAFSAFVICVIIPIGAKLRLYWGRGQMSRAEVGLDIVLLVISFAMAGVGTVYTFIPTPTR